MIQEYTLETFNIFFSNFKDKFLPTPYLLKTIQLM